MFLHLEERKRWTYSKSERNRKGRKSAICGSVGWNLWFSCFGDVEAEKGSKFYGHLGIQLSFYPHNDTGTVPTRRVILPVSLETMKKTKLTVCMLYTVYGSNTKYIL